MKINFFLFLLLASNAVSADLVNEILVDEFTDEETVALTFLADDDHEIFRRWGQISCNQGTLILGIEDSELYHGEDYVNAKFRFDKNTTFERTLNFDVNSSVALTDSEEIIFKFLDELRGSKNLIIKLQSTDSSMKFSDFQDSEKKVEQFLKTIINQTNC